MNLPPVIPTYIDASNAHDVRAIVGCFADDAVVRDENAMRHGKIDIRRWAMETIEKYKYQFKPPLSADERGAEMILSVEASGSFPGSPVTLEYQFTIANHKIQSLIIDS
jgi:SnoaL-like domain